MKGIGLHALWLPVAMLATACGNGAFTAEERTRIGQSPDEGIMRLWTIDDRSDSLLLRRKAAPLDRKAIASAEFAVLKERMLATVNDSTNQGVGIAAPQVGISRRLIAVQRFDKQGFPFEFYANPEIVYASASRHPGREGCLSIPGRSGTVLRSDTIVLRYTDETSFDLRADTVTGFTAVIFQHETDHLDGVLYIDKLAPENDDTPTERKMRERGLVNLAEAVPSLRVNLVYATPDNFMGVMLYEDLHKAFALPAVASNLREAQRKLAERVPGAGLLVYDAARPFPIQKRMWEKAVALDKTYYVADTAKGGGLHNYGAAVDVTIVDSLGCPLPMGTPFDFFGEEANTDREKELLARGRITREELANRKLLREIMTGSGFLTVKSEWWHFNLVRREEARETLKLIE